MKKLFGLILKLDSNTPFKGNFIEYIPSLLILLAPFLYFGWWKIQEQNLVSWIQTWKISFNIIDAQLILVIFHIFHHYSVILDQLSIIKELKNNFVIRFQGFCFLHAFEKIFLVCFFLPKGTYLWAKSSGKTLSFLSRRAAFPYCCPFLWLWIVLLAVLFDNNRTFFILLAWQLHNRNCLLYAFTVLLWLSVIEGVHNNVINFVSNAKLGLFFPIYLVQKSC